MTRRSICSRKYNRVTLIKQYCRIAVLEIIHCRRETRVTLAIFTSHWIDLHSLGCPIPDLTAYRHKSVTLRNDVLSKLRSVLDFHDYSQYCAYARTFILCLPFGSRSRSIQVIQQLDIGVKSWKLFFYRVFIKILCTYCNGTLFSSSTKFTCYWTENQPEIH